MREVLRRFRLWRATWQLRIRGAIDRLRLDYERAVCPHTFRPARIGGKPGRYCKICEASQELTQEDFYAQFGERGLGMLTTESVPWQPPPPEIHVDGVQ